MDGTLSIDETLKISDTLWKNVQTGTEIEIYDVTESKPRQVKIIKRAEDDYELSINGKPEGRLTQEEFEDTIGSLQEDGVKLTKFRVTRNKSIFTE